MAAAAEAAAVGEEKGEEGRAEDGGRAEEKARDGAASAD